MKKVDVNDIIGKKFGKLTVLKFDHKEKYIKGRNFIYFYLCKCECGNLKVLRRHKLLNNETLSCGCLLKLGNGRKHSLSRSRIYNIYRAIIKRCYMSNDPSYDNYGARGITVCKEWTENFMTFYNWAVNNGYADNLTIDRINVNGNYEPNNCRWVDRKTQANNRRNNHLLTHQGETHTLAEWAKIIGIPPSTIKTRLSHNWIIEKVLSISSKTNQK